MTGRVLVIGEGQPSRLVCLGEQIERHVPGADICGVVYRISESVRRNFTSRITKAVHSLGSSLCRLMLSFIHGSSLRQRETDELPENLSFNESQCPAWDLCPTHDVEAREVIEFAERCAPDLIIFLEIDSICVSIASLAKHGAIQGKRQALDDNGSESILTDMARTGARAVRLKVLRVGKGRDETPLVSVDIFRQPLDTDDSFELKSSLILRDLTVQCVAEIGRHPDPIAAANVHSWAQRMIPPCFTGPEFLQTHSIVDQAPPVRLRSTWKLCVYSVLMLSPFVMLRNWLRYGRKRHPILILNAHLISDRHHRMTISTDTFLRIARFLRTHYEIVSLSHASNLLKSGWVKQPTVVLTFDDGYEDNFVNLRAVSEELRIPVVMFVSTQPIDGQNEFSHDIGRGLFGFRALNWEQVRYWSADGTEFQSHTCSHFDCGSEDQETLEQEILGSKQLLELQLKKPVTSLAFPFGKPENMSSAALAVAARAYDHFLSDYGGENLPGQSKDYKHLFRRDLQANIWESELELQGVFEIIKHVKRITVRLSRPLRSGRLEADRVQGSELTDTTSAGIKA